MVEIDNIVNEDNEIETNPISNDGVEPEVKQTIEKKKKPRSKAQIEAFEKAIAKRKSNLEAKKKKVNIVEKKPQVIDKEMKIEKQNTNNFPTTQTGINPLDINLQEWINQENTPEPQVEPQDDDDDDDDDYDDDDDDGDDEESTEEEEEIIVRKKPKTKPIPIPKKKPVPKNKPIEKKKKPKIVYVSDSSDDDEPQEKDTLSGMTWRDRSRLRGF